MPRRTVSVMHRIAGVLAFVTIVAFWTATAAAELFGGAAAIAAVKQAVLAGMIVLIPAIAAAGITGYRLGGKSRAPTAAAKRTRMPVIALNGILVLVPAAVFLAARSQAGTFDGWFVAVQAIELAAGALNITLMALNIRDGLRLSGRLRRNGGAVRTPSAAASAGSAPRLERRR